MTQPTLSRQLKQLEQELGVPLFTRGKHSVSLTEEGSVFARRAKDIVSLIDRSKSELANAKMDIVGEIAIGCNESCSMNHLAKLIATFRKDHPLVTYQLRSGKNSYVRDLLNQGLIDIGLLTELADATKFRYVRLPNSEEWGVLVNETSPLANLSSVRNEDLAGLPMLTIEDETIHSELTFWAGDYARIMSPFAHYSLVSSAATIVRETGGVVVCSRPNAEYKGLVFVPLEPKLELSSLLAWKDNQKFNKAAQTFIDRIVEIHKLES